MKREMLLRKIVCFVVLTCILMVTSCSNQPTPSGNAGDSSGTQDPGSNPGSDLIPDIAPHTHVWDSGNITKSSSCTSQGSMKYVCTYEGCTASKVVTIPALGHTADISTGICNVCKEQAMPTLSSPIVSYVDGNTIYWERIDGADCYEILISNIDLTVELSGTSIDLAEYYGTNTTLQLYIRAIAPEGSEYVNSSYYHYIFKIPEGNIVDYISLGLGQSVNLLTGSYTNYTNVTGSGNSISIFDSNLFNRLSAVQNPITEKQHNTEIVYSDSLESYTQKLTSNISNKFTLSTSVDAFGMAKVTAGFSFGVDSNYEKKTYNETQAIFYDMNYYYRGYQAEIAGLSDPQSLSYALSEEFMQYVNWLAEGEITAKQFIDKFGTHVITSGIYGASFLARAPK